MTPLTKRLEEPSLSRGGGWYNFQMGKCVATHQNRGEFMEPS